MDDIYLNENSKRISKSFWIWGQFSQEEMVCLDKIKKKVNTTLNGLEFEIHITLAGPLLNFDSQTISQIREISRKQEKFRINLKNYNLSDAKFTSLFIEVEKTKTLLLFRDIFFSKFMLQHNRVYYPHISLYYGLEKKEKKEKVIKSLPNLPFSCCIQKICVVDVDENINQWRILNTFLLK